MKQFLTLLALLMTLATVPVAITSCADDETTPGTATPQPPKPEEPEEPDPLTPTLTATVRYDKAKLTAYHFNYHSTDPYGNPAILSAAITIGDEVEKNKNARGLLIYNRTSAFTESDAPTNGELTAQKILVGSGLITISADHYGFGATADKHQAYGIGIPNAQSSIDALIAAKKLLPQLGYRWNDKILFNVGYSQGGQTALAVVKLITEQHPELQITHSVIGGGTYDICATYRKFIETDYSDLPGTVVAVMLSFNEYFGLHIPLGKLFREPLLSHIYEWYYSKQYSLGNICRKIGDVPMSQYVTDEIMDLTSPTSQLLMSALDQDNLCAGWTPRQNESITLVHHKADRSVPYENTERFYAYAHDELHMNNVTLQARNWTPLFNTTEHETGAIYFALACVNKISSTLGILPWVDVFSLDIF